jgi:hypothetical protein
VLSKAALAPCTWPELSLAKPVPPVEDAAVPVWSHQAVAWMIPAAPMLRTVAITFRVPMSAIAVCAGPASATRAVSAVVRAAPMRML